MARKIINIDTEHLKVVEDFLKKHKNKVIGIDEVGRGALAGPILVGAVGFKERFFHTLITDSKQLSRKERFLASDIIMEKYDYLEFEHITVDEINSIKANINTLTKKAIYNILDDAAKRGITGALVDWLYVDHPKVEVLSFPSMEMLSIETAAASIVAKIKRDKIMAAYDSEYPNYSFKKNKGYGTEEHILAIKNHDISKIHRKFYCKKALQTFNNKKVEDVK